MESSCGPDSSENTVMTKKRILKNLIIMCLGYLFLFSSFLALANLQSTLNNAGGMGVISQSVIYGALIISACFLPKLIIDKFGCKTTIAISILMYAPYVAANFYPTAWTLIPTAFLLGTGAGPLWASANTYINNLSYLYAREDADKAELITPFFFGIFLMFFQGTQIWGNLVSFLVLKPMDNNSTHDSIVNSNRSLSCGVNFCGGIGETLQPPSEYKKNMLIGIYLTLSILAGTVVAIFLDSLPRKEKQVVADESWISKLVSTFRQLKKVDQLLLAMTTAFCGLAQGFIFGDYTEAYVACAWGLENVGLVFVCYGVVDSITSILTGFIVKYIPRTVLMTVAASSNVGVCITLFYWKPSSDNSTVMFAIVGFWALSDAIWQTQLSALYGILFRADEEAAFANNRMFQALGFMIAFSCSSVLCTSSKIYMLLAFLFFGFAAYIMVEFRTFRQKKCYFIST